MFYLWIPLGITKETIAELSMRIKAEDKHIDAMIAKDYPAAQKLLTIPGVGPITALSFVMAKFWVHPVRLAVNIGFPPKELREIEKLVELNKPEIEAEME